MDTAWRRDLHLRAPTSLGLSRGVFPRIGN